MRSVLLAALFLSFLPGQTLNKLNVAVLDPHGQPVTDLTGADFQILDDGKPQPIVFFRFTGGKPAQAALGPREYSNRSAVPRHTVVILFDMLNDRLLGDAVVENEMVSALKNLESSQSLYLYLITPRGALVPVHPLPASNTQVTAETEPWTRHIAPLLDQAIKSFGGFHPVDELDLKNRYEETTAALGSLGEQMTEITGRKAIVWVSHGFPIVGYSLSLRSRVDFTNPLRQFYERLAFAQVLLYPVDQSRRGSGADLVSESEATLQEAAESTGGRRLTSDRIGEAVNSALTDARGNYEIVYAIPGQKNDKKRHKVRVTSPRKDLHILSLQGYATPPAPGDMRRDSIEKALGSPFDATDIGLRASLVPDAAPVAAAQKRALEILVDPTDLLLQKSGENHTGHLDILVAVCDARGCQQATDLISLDLNLTPAQFETARGGLALHPSVEIPATAEWLRAIVYDQNLNATGSVRIPLKP